MKIQIRTNQNRMRIYIKMNRQILKIKTYVKLCYNVIKKDDIILNWIDIYEIKRVLTDLKTIEKIFTIKKQLLDKWSNE